jgi:integrase/recombinase XerD
MILETGDENGEERGISLFNERGLFKVGSTQLPNLIVRAGGKAARRFAEFFTATIRNRNTRAAYAQAVGQFCIWCEGRGIELEAIGPLAVATYIEQLCLSRSAPTVKQHLAAIRMLFDWLVIGHIVSVNPAWSVRGPRHVVKKGKTPVLTASRQKKYA